MSFVFNPFTGNFDAVTDAADPIAAPFSFFANCLASDEVGECVYVAADSGVPEVSKAVITDILKMPAIGIIASKPTPTSCTVTYLGVASLMGLLPGKRYFLGADSKPTAICPAAPAFIQLLGVALDTTRLLFSPSPHLTKII